MYFILYCRKYSDNFNVDNFYTFYRLFTLKIFTSYHPSFRLALRKLYESLAVHANLIGYTHTISHIFNSPRGLILLPNGTVMSIVSCRKEFVRRFDRFVFKYERQCKPHCGLLLSCTSALIDRKKVYTRHDRENHEAPM